MDNRYCSVIKDLTAEILKAQHMKKKVKKQANPLEELTRNPSFNSKDPKKQSITQTKSVYTSIGEYFKENFTKSGFNR
jgi:hypothetical protein